MNLESAILETLAYSDIFDYPLTVGELHRFLGISASQSDVEQCAAGMKNISFNGGFYYLLNRDEIVALRKNRESASRKVFNRAIFYGRILGSLPFIRMVALTGSLSMLNLSKNPDMDYMLVTKNGRLWTARAFAILLGKIGRLFGDTICPNLIVSENSLEWPVHDLYSARELCQMIPITGANVYLRLFAVNPWVESFLPNASPKTSHAFQSFKVWKAAEFPLLGFFGDRLESWEMTRKIARFSKQAGFSDETVFTADICQGNFDHHRQVTYAVYKERLSSVNIELNKHQSV